jgi:hypothetical protein
VEARGEEGSASKSTEARGEEATTVVVEQMVPAEEMPEMAAPERLEVSGVVASNAALDESGTSGRIAAASEGDLRARSSEQPDEGMNWAIVQHGVPADFVRTEHKEEEIW